MRRYALAALALILLTVVTRLPAIVHPRPIDDEGIYSVVANEIVDGGRPYVDAIERKPPLLFWVYAAVFEIAGKFNWPALHLVAVAWTLFTMAGLYVLARGLFDHATGVIAALLYSIFQMWATWKNLAFNGELLMNLPLVWAWAIALGPARLRCRCELLAAGALSCAAFLLKQPAAIAAIPLGAYLLLPSYRASRGLTVRESFVHACLFVAVFFGALGVVVAVLWREGILNDAYYWTITHHDVPHVFLTHGILNTMAFFGACLPLLIGAALSLADRALWQGRSAERAALTALLAASAIGTAASGRFYMHYYIQLVPPLAILAAAYYAQLWSDKRTQQRWLLSPRLICAWLALTVIAFSIAHWYGLASRRAPTESGRYLLQHSSPDDRVFVWGQAPRIYLDARRRPASRYISTFPLTGYIFGGTLEGIDTRSRIVPGAWETLEQDFKRHPPTYIVDTQNRPHAPYRIEQFPILAEIVTREFQPVARTSESLIYRRRDLERSLLSP